MNNDILKKKNPQNKPPPKIIPKLNSFKFFKHKNKTKPTIILNLNLKCAATTVFDYLKKKKNLNYLLQSFYDVDFDALI